MPLVSYHVYLVDARDRIQSRIDLYCENDAVAIERAQNLFGEHTIELWRDQSLLLRSTPDDLRGMPEQKQKSLEQILDQLRRTDQTDHGNSPCEAKPPGAKE